MKSPEILLEARVHTQGIESTWGAFKRLRKQQFGDPQESLKGHLFTYMWRRYHNHKKLLNHLLTELLTYRRDVDGSSPPTNPVLPLLQPRQGVHLNPSSSHVNINNVQQQVAFPNAPVNQNAPPPYQQFLPYQQLPPPPYFGQGLQPQPPQTVPALPVLPQNVPAVPLIPQIGPHPPQLQNGQNNQESDEDDDAEMQDDPTSDDDVDYSSDSDSADVPVTVSNTGRRNDVRGRPRTVRTRGTGAVRGGNQGSATRGARGRNQGARGAARGRNSAS